MGLNPPTSSRAKKKSTRPRVWTDAPNASDRPTAFFQKWANCFFSKMRRSGERHVQQGTLVIKNPSFYIERSQFLTSLWHDRHPWLCHSEVQILICLGGFMQFQMKIATAWLAAAPSTATHNFSVHKDRTTPPSSITSPTLRQQSGNLPPQGTASWLSRPSSFPSWHLATKPHFPSWRRDAAKPPIFIVMRAQRESHFQVPN